MTPDPQVSPHDENGFRLPRFPFDEIRVNGQSTCELMVLKVNAYHLCLRSFVQSYYIFSRPDGVARHNCVIFLPGRKSTVKPGALERLGCRGWPARRWMPTCYFPLAHAKSFHPDVRGSPLRRDLRRMQRWGGLESGSRQDGQGCCCRVRYCCACYMVGLSALELLTPGDIPRETCFPPGFSSLCSASATGPLMPLVAAAPVLQ
jgi:hypothetical protein